MKFGRGSVVRLTVITLAVVVVVLGAVVLFRGAGQVSAGGLGPGTIAPTPKTQSFPTSQQLHYVAGPFISQAQAVSIALSIDAGGPGAPAPTFLQATLESVAAASKAMGARVAMMSVGSDRMVWLVDLQGTYQPPQCPPVGSCMPAMKDQTYSVAIDAITGQVLSVGPYSASAAGGS